VFQIASDDAVLVLIVFPHADERARKQYPYLFNQAQLAARRKFYGTAQPEAIPLGQLAAHYRKLAHEHGFASEWHFFQRYGAYYYFVLKINRAPARRQNGH